jgi:glycosyltransferase involved in cell wall biosynthesis
MKGAPGLSVFLPVYNAAPYLRVALDSVLGQSFGDFELVVVDDGSNDASPDILRSVRDRRLRVLRNRHNLGQAGTFNRGFAACLAPLIARMDADDISEPRRFELQVRWMARHPDTDLLGTWAHAFGEDRKSSLVRAPTGHRQIMATMPFENPIIHPSVMVRSAWVKRKPLFRKAYPPAEDYDLWSRLAREGARFSALPDPLLRYRLHPGQSSRGRAMAEANARVRQDWLAWLGLRPTAQEMHIHLGLCDWRFRGGRGAFRELEAWMGSLEEAGIRKGLDPAAWRDALTRRWNGALALAPGALGLGELAQARFRAPYWWLRRATWRHMRTGPRGEDAGHAS